MIRFFDVLLSFLGLVFGWPVFGVVFILCYFDTGSPIFFQVRVGRYQEAFTLIKFRTMRVGTVDMATHLVGGDAVTRLGRILRKTRLDELPQLWNVLKGEMSLVGPRPCLFNQTELLSARARMGIFDVRPGLTGLAQISGVNMSIPKKLVAIEVSMLETMSIQKYFWYIWRTVVGGTL